MRSSAWTVAWTIMSSGGPAKCMIAAQSIHSIRQQNHIHEMSSRKESDFARLEQLLQEERRNRQEADERAEQERRRAEGERRNRPEADERAEQERRRAEGERQNRPEADERAEQERRRAEGEQRNRQEAESRPQIEGKKTRPTTFEEYIRACHALLSKPLRIQTDKSLSTQGSITSPKNKPCPTFLKL